MLPKELARRNVDAAVKRLVDARLVVAIEPSADWSPGILAAAEAIRASWKPDADQLFARVEQRLAEYHGPAGAEPVSMDIVIWHLEHMAQEAFATEMQRHHVPEPDAQRARRRLTLEKWKG
ncbi:MAG TPA: hypothetical protein VK797_00160 [Tepidisphaeraceae bacterium]|jgi:hypothetical protein|nr:hypothetical protein [Tepidisphaeraceae bacterium]